MSWIEEIEIDEAEGKLKRIYDEIENTRGKLSKIMKVHSLNPGAMEAHMDLYLSVMFEDSTLTREEGEMIAVVVSQANGCKYCVEHHSEALDHYWRDEEKVSALADDHIKLDLSEKHHTMLDFAEKLTEAPDSIAEEDVESLKNDDFSDQDILNIVLVTGYFNFVNRIALGLGLDVHEEEVGGYEY
ncbi:MAG: peroxidase-related enzyme [Candidatus Thermoplasmatota archaeon]